jgi:hypothetical protein
VRGEGDVYVMGFRAMVGEGCGAEVRGVVGTCGRNLKPSWKKGHQRQTTCVCKLLLAPRLAACNIVGHTPGAESSNDVSTTRCFF